jgi:serine/threonine protein kinase
MQELLDGELFDMLFKKVQVKDPDTGEMVESFAPRDWLQNLQPLFKEQLARYFLREMINGLEYLHNIEQIRGSKAQPHAHLDIKLHNVLVDSKGLRFKVCY